MLINWQNPKHVYIVCGKTDLRKGIDGLAIVVAENFGLDLYDDSLFYSVVIEVIGLRAYIGMVKVSSYCINDLKMAGYVGHVIEMMLIS